MRIVVLFLVMLLVACGAGVPSGTMPDAGDATDATPAAGDTAPTTCDDASVVDHTGRCVGRTVGNCNGVMCRPGYTCGVYTLHPPDAGPFVVVECI